MSLKRLMLAIGIAGLIVFGVSACGGGDTETVTVEGGGAASEEEVGSGGGGNETVSIVASVPPTDHGWLGAISKNAQAQADEYDDVDFKLLEAADADSQAQQIEQVI